MLAYFVRRTAFAIFLVFAVSSASLLLAKLAPGDYVTETMGIAARRETIEEARAKLGLNRSVAAQYRDWLVRAAHFDFGRSLQYDQPVIDLIPGRAANTAILAVSALVVATLLGLPLGVVTGSYEGNKGRKGRKGWTGWTGGISWMVVGTIRSASLVLLSLPPLLTSLFLVFAAAKTGLLPVGGMTSSSGGDLLAHMVVPVAALALPLIAMFERLQSQAMSEVAEQPFVTATLGRGVPRSRVIWRDALKNALRPIASIYGLVVGTLLSGSFAVEAITAWPGLGSLMLSALRARDVYLVTGCAAAGSIFLAAGTLMSDAALALVDPRTAHR